ncbi:kinase-like protein [Heliocybe sulcata]|uniref:Kinase-like protein n=1 Tax=Heliocybe sulcata TaxID=5364 RepID=A0A5C3MVC7_9AGAM|nr:kinase-like protein [Heliocybe sulcata]
MGRVAAFQGRGKIPRVYHRSREDLGRVFICYGRGRPYVPLCTCLSFHDRPDIDDASTSLRPNADHPLQNGSVWPAFLVAVVVADAAPSLSSYYASARHRVLDLLSCIIPLTCARIPPSQWNNIDQTLRHRLMVDKADVSYHDWVNQYPSAWRPAITLLSHQEWQYIEELHNKYTRAPATPWERDRLGRKCATYLQASCHFLHDRWDDRAALGENYDVETLLFSVLWLVEDYRYCRRAFRLRWRPVDMYNDWGAACKTLVLAFRDFPAERSAERSMTCLLQVMERHGHVCRAYGGAMVREMFGGVIGFLGHVTARELVVFQDVVATQKPIPDTLYVPSFLVEPMRCSLCTWTNNDSWAILPVAFGQELCTKLSVLHVRMQFAETRDDFMSVLNIGIEAGDALTAYADSALEACPPVLTEQILRTWISLLYLIFESRTFKSEPDEVLGEMENLCRDRLVERATYGAELPTSSPVEFMELLQNLLDDSKDYHDILVPSGRTQCVLDPPFRKALHRLLMKLGEETKALLPSIFMRNVEFSGNAPVTGGGFADVYKGHVGDMVVALKRIRMYETNDIEKLNKLFQREALVWRQLRHPHILPFLGMHPSPNSNPYLVSPWMERGNMMTCRRQNMFLEADIHRLLDEIAQGLFYLHSENIVHGDICGRNILIDDQGHARLADFGLSVLAEATKGAYTESHSTGSERWQPAELLDFTRTSFRKTRETDVYAFGCVCLELCTGKKPYSYIPNGSFAYAVIRGQKPKRPAPEEAVGLRDDFWDLMQKCWEKEPQDRVPWQWLSNWVSNIRRSGRPGMMGYGASR